MLNICVKVHGIRTFTYFSRNQNKRHERTKQRTNQPTNKQTRPMTISPGGGSNSSINYQQLRRQYEEMCFKGRLSKYRDVNFSWKGAGKCTS